MADESKPDPNEPKKSRRFPNERQRKRLRQLFDAAAKQDALNKYDYASALYADCVRGDPGNIEYVQSLIVVLQKRYVSVKKLGMVQFKARPERGALKKAIAQCNWDEALQQGVEVLLVNPWDVPTLTSMAAACAGILKEEGMTVAVSYGDCELYYLKCAFDTFPRDKPDATICQQLAETLAKRDRIVEAISFWHKVEIVRPDDELPKRAIATLTVLLHDAKAREGRVEERRSTATGPGGKAKPEEVTHEDRLKQRIQRNPKDLAGYDELVSIYLHADLFDKAIEILQQKLQVANNDVQVQEAIEDVQLKALRSQMIAADTKAKTTGKEADVKAFNSIRKTLVEKELQTYRNRCDRYPSNLGFRFELGRRYQLNGDIPEAIKELQVAKSDPRKRGVCMLALGDCFFHVKQYSLAMDHFEQAIQDIPDRDADNKKKALFQAGKLALGLRDLAKAKKHLTTLASMDYTYPRISEFLDRLKQLEEEEKGKKPRGAEKPPKKEQREEGEGNEGEESEE